MSLHLSGFIYVIINYKGQVFVTIAYNEFTFVGIHIRHYQL